MENKVSLWLFVKIQWPDIYFRRIQEGCRSMANSLEYNTSRSNANFTLWDTWCGKPGAMSFYRYHLVYIMLTMPVTSTTAERSFSVLRRLKTYVRTTMNNDRLSSLALMHIHRDFSVDLVKVMEKIVSAKNRFWAILSKFCLTKSWNQCVAYVFNLPMKTPQNAPFCIWSKNKFVWLLALQKRLATPCLIVQVSAETLTTRQMILSVD